MSDHQSNENSEPSIGGNDLAKTMTEAMPELGMSTKRPVTMRLVTNEADSECRFWVGLSKPGAMSPQDMMDYDDVTEIFDAAAQKGVTSDGALMLSDAFQYPPRYVYLRPAPADDFRERTIWVQEVVKTVTSWEPRSSGFYLAPALLETEQGKEVLLLTMRQLIENSKTSDYYLLVGDHGLNTVLNVALDLRQELDSENIELFVFH